ncbi:MAG: type II toxin-antitoxin system VapC family toxin [Saprospiraceae bacterium]
MEKGVILDTKAVVSLLRNDLNLIKFISEAPSIGISVITQIEFLSFSNLTENDIKLFWKFVERINVFSILASDIAFVNKIIEVRKKYKLKLPDAIIATTAIINQAVLITADGVFNKITGLEIRFSTSTLTFHSLNLIS